MKIQNLYTIFLKHPNIVTDTRKIVKNSLFFALKGDNFDGNKFAQQALEKGCAVAVIDNPNNKQNDNYIVVNNVLETLQKLAKHHRENLKIPIIGITGSNGKTTTKELIKSILSQKLNCFATYGNLNNHIGVPISLLSINNQHEVGIIEMGANHQKEIEFLCTIAQPDFGLITNIGKAHLEGFGGIEGVKKGKTELFNYLIANNKKAFINKDDNNLNNYIAKIESITFGKSENNFCVGKLDYIEPTLKVSYKTNYNTGEITSNLIGQYNYTNILVALTIGSYFKLSDSEIKKGIENYTPQNSRSQLIKTKKNTIILDAYNANPTSMEAALKNLHTSKASKKLAVLGDMLELGDDSKKEHRNILNTLIQLNINAILVGKEFGKINQTDFKKFKTAKEAGKFLKKTRTEDTLILIKGSRAIKLENVIESIS
jgi:UDP-N-acetylmuramoyl-tripeptide--D-alanyl-D-alanine ligase